MVLGQCRPFANGYLMVLGQYKADRDVDNILSKKFKPSSSHILEIYFEKKTGIHKHFRTDLLADHLQVNKLEKHRFIQ